MYKKLSFIFALFLIPSFVYAHSGRLDGSGGHRVNNKWIYKGEYLVIKNNVPELKNEEIIFNKGNYHYHAKPSQNKIDLNNYRDGIYIPVIEKDIKNTMTSNIVVSSENKVASKSSNLYHNPSCKYIQNIKEENAIIFEDKEDAEKSGYIPHKNCSAGQGGGQ